MSNKRISVAAGLSMQGSRQKAGRPSAGPLVACAKFWGGADWIFEGTLA